MFPKIKSRRGFTLVEALVAISIFLVIISATTGIFTDAFASQRKAEVSKLVYEEARIALERVVKEVRRGTIDYEEYFSQKRLDPENYGENYGEYAAKFYQNCSPLPCVDDLLKSEVDRFSENIGENSGAVPLDQNLQKELYLITADGSEKTILKLLSEEVASGFSENRLAMLKLSGSDSNADGTIDSWTPEVDFPNSTFQKIQPDSIQITALQFFVAPLEDPRKDFAKFTDAIQQQPHVTIVLTAAPSVLRAGGIRGEVPTITLQTTIVARAQNEVESI